MPKGTNSNVNNNINSIGQASGIAAPANQAQINSPAPENQPQIAPLPVPQAQIDPLHEALLIQEEQLIMLAALNETEQRFALRERREPGVHQIHVERVSDTQTLTTITFLPPGAPIPGTGFPPGPPVASLTACLASNSGVSRQLVAVIGESLPSMARDNFSGLIGFGLAVLVVTKSLFHKK